MYQSSSRHVATRRAFLHRVVLGASTASAGLSLTSSLALAQPALEERVTQQAVDTILAGWPEKHKEVAKRLIETYGLPDGGTTTSRLMWLRNTPWKYTILYRDEAPHNFPLKHTDILEQAIDYRVPLDKLMALATYNGSITVRRTKGELSTMCGQEGMNFLALNIAHALIAGQVSVEEARQNYTAMALDFLKGHPSPATQKLQFQVPQTNTEDADQATIRS